MKCQFIKDNKEICQGNSMINSNFCFLHNPEIPEEDKKMAQIKGGKAQAIKVKEKLPPAKIEHSTDVVLLLADTINLVRSGDLDIRIANTIGYLCGHLIRAFELAEVEKRIETVERFIYERKFK